MKSAFPAASAVIHGFFGLLLIMVFLPSIAQSEEIDCLKCHGKLTKEKIIHPALNLGCTTCHDAINAKTVPHKKTGKIAKGLSAEQPDLCYGCHDKSAFAHKTVHAAIGMGCTGCHNPHSSKNTKLLIATPPDLCFTCHDKTLFGKTTVHAPVAGGMCLSCHTPHASDDIALLKKKPYEVCIECHEEIAQKPHATSGRHPVGKPRKNKPELMDPSRPGRSFYCGSCHDPHSTDGPRLFRFNATSDMNLCKNCHQM